MMKESLLTQELTYELGRDTGITEALINPTSLNQQRLWFLSQLEPDFWLTDRFNIEKGQEVSKQVASH